MSIRVASPCLRHGCAKCCYDTQMPLTEADAARLVALGHDSTAFSQVAADGSLILCTDPSRAGPEGAPCHFLREGRCSVYADRPTGCRIYPFVLDEGDKIVRDEDCPHRDEFPADTTVRARLLRVVRTIVTEAGERRPQESDQGGR